MGKGLLSRALLVPCTQVPGEGEHSCVGATGGSSVGGKERGQEEERGQSGKVEAVVEVWLRAGVAGGSRQARQ